MGGVEAESEVTLGNRGLVGPQPRTEGIGSHLGVRLADRAQLLLRAHTGCQSQPHVSSSRLHEPQKSSPQKSSEFPLIPDPGQR